DLRLRRLEEHPGPRGAQPVDRAVVSAGDVQAPSGVLGDGPEIRLLRLVQKVETRRQTQDSFREEGDPLRLPADEVVLLPLFPRLGGDGPRGGGLEQQHGESGQDGGGGGGALHFTLMEMRPPPTTTTSRSFGSSTIEVSPIRVVSALSRGVLNTVKIDRGRSGNTSLRTIAAGARRVILK